MRLIARTFVALIGAALLALVFAPTTHQVAASNPQSVIVTNTPLPVEGTVSLGNTPNVNVANTPTVNVANPVRNVAVFNPLDQNNNPIPVVVNTTGQPYADQCLGSGNPNGTCSMNTLPSGMRLVIQSISISTRSASGVSIQRARMMTTVNGSGPLNLYLALSNTSTDQFGQLFQAATVPATMYADAASQPQCETEGDGQNDFICTIQGYLVPAQ